MTQEEKVNYLRIALNLQNIGVNNEIADRIIETYEVILKKGDKFSVSDAVDIQYRLDKKYIKEKLEGKP